MPSKQHHTCPVCGYKGLREPPRDRAGNPSFEICPSCGTEFGYDDATATPSDLRIRWLKSGAPWFSKSTPPAKNWNPVMQLRAAKLLGALLPTRKSA